MGSTITWNGFGLDYALDWNGIYFLYGMAVELTTFGTYMSRALIRSYAGMHVASA